MTAQPIGTFCLVLHTHLPWLPHAGTWPVGEEWFHQAFTTSWRPVIRLAERLADEGRDAVFTLGITPVVAAMLDDPYLLAETHTWVANWQLRAQDLAGRREPHLVELAHREFRAASECLADIESRWLRGGSAIIRPLVDSGIVELLSGPATHPFQPLLSPRVQRFALATGLDDARLRFGRAPEGIWAPECGYSPGLEQNYASAGVRRFLVDGPTFHGDTAAAHPVGDSDVIAFGRDLEVTYRVWSPRAGYPGDPSYRDFHTFDHASGFRPARVTGKHIPPQDKKPWDPDLAAAAIDRHADDFISVVRNRLTALSERDSTPAMVVAAYDTELFGHWWHEGPQWLDAILRRLPDAGVRVTTLSGAIEAGHVREPRDLPASSWGSGKDWRVWDGEQVADLVADARRVQDVLVSTVDAHRSSARDAALDQLAREALLVLSSDWAFMVTKDSAAHYARRRAAEHSARFDRLAELINSRRLSEAHDLASRLRIVDGPFGHLDARQL